MAGFTLGLIKAIKVRVVPLLQGARERKAAQRALKERIRIQKEEERNKTLVCGDCELETLPEAKCCHKCGSKHIIPRWEFKLGSTQELREHRKREIADEEKRRRERAAEEIREAVGRKNLALKKEQLLPRFNELLNKSRCNSCHKIFSADVKFCPQCAEQCLLLDREVVIKILLSENPELFRAEEDLVLIFEDEANFRGSFKGHEFFKGKCIVCGNSYAATKSFGFTCKV